MSRWTQQALEAIEPGKPVRVRDAILESDVSRDTRRSLVHHPAVQQVWRVNSGAHWRGTRFIRYHTVPGMSDLWVLLKPRYGTMFAFIELKRPGETETTEQAAFIESMRSRGHIAFVASSEAQVWKLFTEALRERRAAGRA